MKNKWDKQIFSEVKTSTFMSDNFVLVYGRYETSKWVARDSILVVWIRRFYCFYERDTHFAKKMKHTRKVDYVKRGLLTWWFKKLLWTRFVEKSSYAILHKFIATLYHLILIFIVIFVSTWFNILTYCIWAIGICYWNVLST